MFTFVPLHATEFDGIYSSTLCSRRRATPLPTSPSTIQKQRRISQHLRGNRAHQLQCCGRGESVAHGNTGHTHQKRAWSDAENSRECPAPDCPRSLLRRRRVEWEAVSSRFVGSSQQRKTACLQDRALTCRSNAAATERAPLSPTISFGRACSRVFTTSMGAVAVVATVAATCGGGRRATRLIPPESCPLQLRARHRTELQAERCLPDPYRRAAGARHRRRRLPGRRVEDSRGARPELLVRDEINNVPRPPREVGRPEWWLSWRRRV